MFTANDQRVSIFKFSGHKVAVTLFKYVTIANQPSMTNKWVAGFDVWLYFADLWLIKCK